MKASVGRLRFKSTREAIKELGIPYEENDPQAILVWHDSLKDKDYFRHLKPWQVVNRLPNINVLCRKVPFTHLLLRISKYFPSEYSFVPKSFILPHMNSDFMRCLAKRKHRYIVKPDGGSLGVGIKIIEPGEDYAPNTDLCVAQKYIPSLLWNETKFDLRIYVLIASVCPFEIYVYRDGLARFCSEKNEGKNTIFSQITNVTLNKDNVDMEHISDVSKVLSDVLEEMEEKKAVNVQELWEKVDNVIVLTVLSAHKFIVAGEKSQCPKIVYPRCFQILGFDILLDEKLNPYILEVNYRPSLDYYRGRERRMKVGMIADAIKIAAPLQFAQSCISSRKCGWGSEEWMSFANDPNHEFNELFSSGRKNAAKETNFHRVFPASSHEKQILYDRVIRQVDSMPLDFIPGMKNAGL